MQPARLNIFQRIMRIWDCVHPYNAAQAMHLRGPADIDLLRRAWTDAMRAMGIGRSRIQGNTFEHLPFEGRADEEVTFVEEGADLATFVTREMNRPMERIPGAAPGDSFVPIRPFVIRAGENHFAGVIYHHWAADSTSIRTVIREWFLRAFDPTRAQNKPLTFPAGGLWRLFGPDRAKWSFAEGIGSALRLTTRFSNARRVERPVEDYNIAASTYTLPDGTVAGLKTYARREKVSINDIFLAAMAEACDQHGIMPRRPGRQEIVLGTVADLRPSSPEDLTDVFGLFLGFTTNVLRPAELNDFPRMVRTIASQTAFQKRSAAAAASQMRMAAAVAEASLMSPQKWVKFYQQHLPLAAAISNVNLDRTWAGEYHPKVLLDYLRFTPTGPTLPMIFTPSSIGGRLNLVVTRRTALVDDATAGRLVGSFFRRLGDLRVR